MRRFLSLVLLVGVSPLFAADWEKVTDGFAKKEGAGFGGLCGIAVDPTTGDLIVQVSDKGLYRSTDHGATFTPFGKPFKGRTEWPGSLLFDPTGKSKRFVCALVYGSPVLVGDRETGAYSVLDAKSGHVDWCAADWTSESMKFLIAFKHEAGGLLLRSTDGGKLFDEIGKGYSAAWVFDATTAVVSYPLQKGGPNQVMRTTDAGKTWTAVLEHTTRALPKWHDGRLHWLTDDGLWTTADQGKTWSRVSELKDAKYGPVFGKTAERVFVLTKSGIVESTDGGKTWSKPIALPADLKGWSTLMWIDFDPKNDLLYVMKMGSELYRMKR